jgi:hypothetical protein
LIVAQRLSLGVDALARAFVVPRPAADQTSTGALHLSALELRSDNEVLICWRDIEAGSIIGERIAFILDAECASDVSPFFPSESEPSAHSIKPR